MYFNVRLNNITAVNRDELGTIGSLGNLGNLGGARWPRGQCVWRAIAKAKQRS
jgi:hypothetical protein